MSPNIVQLSRGVPLFAPALRRLSANDSAHLAFPGMEESEVIKYREWERSIEHEKYEGAPVLAAGLAAYFGTRDAPVRIRLR